MLARDAGSGYIIPTCIRSVKARGGGGGGGGGGSALLALWDASSSGYIVPTCIPNVKAWGEAACICNFLVIMHNGRGRGGGGLDSSIMVCRGWCVCCRCPDVCKGLSSS